MKNILEKEQVPDTAAVDYFPALYAIGEYEVQSICSTCIHADSCVYRGDGERTVVSCDEFETAGKTAAETARDRMDLLAKNKRPAKEGPRIFKGLCANCDHRQHCQYADTETGIWYCEEYK
jgi:hypothetical protein